MDNIRENISTFLIDNYEKKIYGSEKNKTLAFQSYQNVRRKQITQNKLLDKFND